MAIYKKLSILEGGGIVLAKQQARQVSNTVNLFIGLGVRHLFRCDFIKTRKGISIYECAVVSSFS